MALTVHSVCMVGNPEVIVDVWSAIRAPGSLCAEAGTGRGRPFPGTPFLASSAPLRCASDRYSLTKPNFQHDRDASVALRSDGVRDHPGMTFGFPRNERSASPESQSKVHAPPVWNAVASYADISDLTTTQSGNK